MLKFLAWLLVPLLPLVGFVSAALMRETDHSLWRMNFQPNQAVSVLGYADQGQTLLLAERPYDEKKLRAGNFFEAVIGLNMKTGQQLYRTPLPSLASSEDGYIAMSLSEDGGTLVLSKLQRKGSHGPEVFDWKHNKIIKTYEDKNHGAFNEVQLHCGIMSAIAHWSDQIRLVTWRDDVKEPQCISMLVEQQNRQSPVWLNMRCMEMSQDGKRAHVYTNVGLPSQLFIFDYETRSKLQVIDGCFRGVYWSADHSSFLAIQYEAEMGQTYARKYAWQQGKYVSDESTKTQVALQLESELNRVGNFFAAGSWVQTNPTRLSIAKTTVKYFGMRGLAVIDFLWPPGEEVNVYDCTSGQLLHQTVVPTEWYRSKFYPTSDGKAVILCRDQAVALWGLSHYSGWFPIIGLFIGILSSSLWAWRLLHHRPNLKLPSPILVNTEGAS
ncbi:MAG: hypothetical protein QM703_03150 [Gemmatales bacterium]